MVLHGVLLLGTIDRLQVAHSILCIELNTDLASEAGHPSVQAARLDASLIRHHFQLRVQAGAAVRAEEMLVDLAASTLRVPILWRPWRCQLFDPAQEYGLPLVTLKLVRGTTALDVYGPPVHF